MRALPMRPPGAPEWRSTLGAGSRRQGLSLYAAQEVRQRPDVGVRHLVHDRVHAGVDARAPAVAVGRQAIDQVVETLMREPRHLLAAGVARQVAGAAVELLGEFRPARGERLVDGLGAG